MLPTLIHRYDKNHFIFDQVQNEKLKFYRLADVTFYDRINTIYQFIRTLTWIKKNVYFEDYAAFEKSLIWIDDLQVYVSHRCVNVIS